MSAQRRYKTDEELEAMIDKALSAKFDDFRDEIKNIVMLQSPYLQTIANGAQASMMTSTALFGDEARGVKGFMPETREALASLDRRVTQQDDRIGKGEKLTERRHRDNLKRFNKALRNQGILKKCLDYLIENDKQGKPKWKTLVAIASSLPVTYVAHWAYVHGGYWWGEARKIISRIL